MLSPAEMYPAGIPGISARFVHLPSGLSLRVLESGPSGGSPVVLVHGWGASAYTYRAAIPALAEAGYRAIALDLPGHGQSDRPADPEAYTRPGLVRVVASLVAALDLRNVCVVGQSMGGAIALELAAARDPHVGRIALVNPVGLSPVRLVNLSQFVTPRALADVAQYLVPRKLVSLFLHLAYADPSLVTEHDVDEYWAPSQFAGGPAALVTCLHDFTWEPLAPERLATIVCPVLLVMGMYDHLIPDSDRGAAGIPRLRVARVPGGHAVNEERPAEVNAALLAFLRE